MGGNRNNGGVDGYGKVGSRKARKNESPKVRKTERMKVRKFERPKDRKTERNCC